MPPKAADKKPAASKAPATASKAPEKKDAGKKTAASGDKKKRTKARKETYSSYIYKGKLHCFSLGAVARLSATRLEFSKPRVTLVTTRRGLVGLHKRIARLRTRLQAASRITR